MTLEECFFQTKKFSLDWNYFSFTQMKKKIVVSLAFQNLTWFVFNSACYKFFACASLHNYFVELDKMQVNIEGVEHDLRWIEQFDSGLCNNQDTQRVIQELGGKSMNEQQQLCKLCFFNL